MKNIIQKLNKDKNISKLMKEFKKDFSRVYDNLSGDEKVAMLGIRDTIFRKWLYSPIIDETYVSPAYLINSIVIDSGEEKAMVLPHIKITVKDDGNLDFESRWIVYSKEEHPVIEDLKKLMNYCDPALIVREGNPYIIDNGETLIEEINFRSGYYLKFIIELALKVGILEEIKAIGCKCYRHSKSFDEFEKKKNEEQLKLIIQTSIHMANEEFKQQLNHNNSEIVNGFLKAFVTLDDFEPYILELEAMHSQSFNEFLNSLDKKEKDKLLGSMENFNVEGAPYVVATTEFGILMDMHFTSVFGYYLGLIIPTYMNMFSIDLFIKMFLWAPDEHMQISAIFQLEACHHLTQLAGEVLETYEKEEVLDNFKTLNLQYTGREVDRYIDSKNEFLKNKFGKDIFSDFEDEEEDDDDEFANVYEVLDEYFHEDEIEVPKVIFKHIVEFLDYLAMEKKLKLETCEKHCGNIELFIWNFLESEKVKDLKKIDSAVIHEYLGDWYISHVATSKTNMKEQISSLTHYSRYLEKKEIINSKIGKEIRDLLKENKEKYLDLFDEYMEEDYYF